MSKDLFSFYGDQALEKNAPLAERLRPRSLDDFVGQLSILGEGRLLRRAIATDQVGNLLLHGPPGVGKTTLARIIALNTRSHFSVLNAVLAGVKELRQEVDAAKKRLDLHGLRTILFIDEVHRFNSAQQDALLPWVENGRITLIGATTENPYFEVNKALVSRSRIFRMQPLQAADLHILLKRALTDCECGYGSRKVRVSDEAVNHLVDVANGDARSLLNALELAVESSPQNEDGFINIDISIAEDSIQERAVLYDKQGDAHFDTISAFIKSLRGSDPDAALFWLARMVEAGENPRFIFRRMLISASEDIGLADPQAIVIVEACAAAFERIGLPEGLYLLTQSALYLATTSKSNSVLAFFDAQRTVRTLQSQEVPNHLRDSHRDGEAFGDGIGYRYPHSFAENWVAQQYLPKKLQGEVFWHPSQQGWEGQHRLLIFERRAAQLAAVVESVEEYPLFLSTGPQIPAMERWVRRQLGQEAERLNHLADRLWADMSWERHHRVLVVAGRSVLWAINPLRSVPEGGVTIAASSLDDKTHLSAQIEFLDEIVKPVVINENVVTINQLPSGLEFEWIGGRLHTEDLKSNKVDDLWSSITQRSAPNAGLRLLISFPGFGPAFSLKQLMSSIGINQAEKNNSLNLLIQEEEKWLKSNRHQNQFLNKLCDFGWEIKVETWEENLTIEIDESLQARWLSEGSVYRVLMEKHRHFQALEDLKEILHRAIGLKLPQQLIHQRITGKRKIKDI